MNNSIPPPPSPPIPPAEPLSLPSQHILYISSNQYEVSSQSEPVTPTNSVVRQYEDEKYFDNNFITPPMSPINLHFGPRELPKNGINFYSFSLNPSMTQPSGTINMSHISDYNTSANEFYTDNEVNELGLFNNYDFVDSFFSGYYFSSNETNITNNPGNH